MQQAAENIICDFIRLCFYINNYLKVYKIDDISTDF